jgi:Restriction endonuclease
MRRRRDQPKHVIVVIDDEPMILEFHRCNLEQMFGNRYDYECFENDEEANGYVRSNAKRILGYIQDVNRSGQGGEGISFYGTVMDQMTPWAKCLFVSGVGTWSLKQILNAASLEKIRFLAKPITYDEPMKGGLEWLVTPLAAPIAKEADKETASIVKWMAPPWRELCRYIVSNQEYLHRMSPEDFERLVGEIFRSFGWEVDFTSRTRDGGHDIIAVRKAQPISVRVLVEAKRWAPTRKVGVDIIRSFYGIKQAKAASQLVLVTSSFVSLDAKKEFARVVPWELDFFERDKILDWCRDQSGVKLLGKFE